jgi:hypothetical protein
MELTYAQYFYGLYYSLLISDLWGLSFKTKELAEKIWQRLSFILLA